MRGSAMRDTRHNYHPCGTCSGGTRAGSSARYVSPARRAFSAQKQASMRASCIIQSTLAILIVLMPSDKPTDRERPRSFKISSRAFSVKMAPDESCGARVLGNLCGAPMWRGMPNQREEREKREIAKVIPRGERSRNAECRTNREGTAGTKSENLGETARSLEK